jgi:hypothetical protein
MLRRLRKRRRVRLVLIGYDRYLPKKQEIIVEVGGQAVDLTCFGDGKVTRVAVEEL